LGDNVEFHVPITSVSFTVLFVIFVGSMITTGTVEEGGGIGVGVGVVVVFVVVVVVEVGVVVAGGLGVGGATGTG
jgi:hypothetical protein